MRFHEVRLQDHEIRFILALLDEKEKQLHGVEPIGNMLPLMAAHDSIEGIREAMPREFFNDSTED